MAEASKVRLILVGDPNQAAMLEQFSDPEGANRFDTTINTQIGSIQVRLMSITYNRYRRYVFSFTALSETGEMLEGEITNSHANNWIEVPQDIFNSLMKIRNK